MTARINSPTPPSAASPALPPPPPPPSRVPALAPHSPSVTATAQQNPYALNPQASSPVVGSESQSPLSAVRNFKTEPDGRAPGEPRREQPRMRASVACEKCRRSKVKCENEGVGSACRACQSQNKPCTYPPAPPLSTVRRKSTGHKGTSDADEDASRKRIKRPIASGFTSAANKGSPLSFSQGDASPKDTARPFRSVDSSAVPSSQSTPLTKSDLAKIFDSNLLTPDVWVELWRAYVRNFAVDLPFLHPSTFCKPTQELSFPDLPHKYLYLAFLTLTVPFHRKLRELGLTAKHYYTAAVAELGDLTSRPQEKCGIERVQAMLMLGLYEWGQAEGYQASLKVTIACRAAFALGLDNDDKIMDNTKGLNGLTPEDKFILEESRRRTFWACFIMDRYVNGGRNGNGYPMNICTPKLRIQLPCHEDTFSSGKAVRTRLIDQDQDQPIPDDSREIPWERMDGEEAPLTHYIRAIDLWTSVMDWTLKGDRRVDGATPPWSPEAHLYRFEASMAKLERHLPSDLRLSKRNTENFCYSDTYPAYALLHSMLCQIRIILHRSYIPWIALSCRNTGPTGPVDAPRFPNDTLNPFWKKSAATCYKAATELTELYTECDRRNRLPETPLSMFAAFLAAVCGVYYWHFPWMDPDGDRDYVVATAKKGFAILEKHRDKRNIKLIDGWWRIIIKMDRRLILSWYESWLEGGGLGEYKVDWEKLLKEFNAEADDISITGQFDEVKGPPSIGEAYVVDSPNTLDDRSMVDTPGSDAFLQDRRADSRPEVRPNFTPINAVVTSGSLPHTTSHPNTDATVSLLPGSQGLYKDSYAYPQYPLPYPPHQAESADRVSLNLQGQHPVRYQAETSAPQTTYDSYPAQFFSLQIPTYLADDSTWASLYGPEGWSQDNMNGVPYQMQLQ